jgi:hypothetical protein
MFHSFYATTKDRKGNEHNYRLPAGTGVPSGHEITNLSVASRFKLSDIVDAETYELLVAMSSKGKAHRAKA